MNTTNLTKQELNAYQRQYAINELNTIDQIECPSEKQIREKMELVASWDWFKHILAHTVA